MHADSSLTLLNAFLAHLDAQGLSPTALDPWHGWRAFKQFARASSAPVDPGTSVQLAADGDREPVHLFFARQVAVEQGGRLQPIGSVVCEFVFAPRRRTPLAWQLWSFDFARFEDFVDAVESTELFADLIATKPTQSLVYWEEA